MNPAKNIEEFSLNNLYFSSDVHVEVELEATLNTKPSEGIWQTD